MTPTAATVVPSSKIRAVQTQSSKGNTQNTQQDDQTKQVGVHDLCSGGVAHAPDTRKGCSIAEAHYAQCSMRGTKY